MRSSYQRQFHVLGLWDSVPERQIVSYQTPVGQVLMGRVTRVAEFGAFIELEPGVEALAHASNLRTTGKKDGWKASVSPDSSVAVEILSVDLERKRIGVGLHDQRAVDEQNDARDYKQRQERQETDGFSVLADKLRAATRRREGS